MLPYARINFPFILPSICLRDMGKTKLIREATEAVLAGSPYRYPLWLARALNSAIYDVKWDYESHRAIARIAVFYAKIAVFYNKFMLLCPIL